MALRTSDLLPCQPFFSRGHIVAGVAALLMQLTIVLWPLAASWARKFSPPGVSKSRRKPNVDQVLAELAKANRAPVDPYAKVPKKFRQTA
jgi:hypothetical protein